MRARKIGWRAAMLVRDEILVQNAPWYERVHQGPDDGERRRYMFERLEHGHDVNRPEIAREKLIGGDPVHDARHVRATEPPEAELSGLASHIREDRRKILPPLREPPCHGSDAAPILDESPMRRQIARHVGPGTVPPSIDLTEHEPRAQLAIERGDLLWRLARRGGPELFVGLASWPAPLAEVRAPPRSTSAKPGRIAFRAVIVAAEVAPPRRLDAKRLSHPGADHAA